LLAIGSTGCWAMRDELELLLWRLFLPADPRAAVAQSIQLILTHAFLLLFLDGDKTWFQKNRLHLECAVGAGGVLWKTRHIHLLQRFGQVLREQRVANEVGMPGVSCPDVCERLARALELLGCE
jgi:hypothetical protein